MKKKRSNIYNLYNNLLVYTLLLWDQYYSWIIIFIVWLFFYIIGMLTIDRLYRFFLVLFLVLIYSSLMQRFSIFIYNYLYYKVETEGVDSIYKWLWLFLKLNLYKNIFLYILLKIDYFVCKFLIFINKKFFGNLIVYKMFNILVKHFTLLVGIHIILYKFYHILKSWATSTPYEIIIKRMYGLIFSILIFTDIITFVKSVIISYPLIGTYSIILLIGILYEIPFTSRMFKLYWQPYYIYEERAEGTVIGIITKALLFIYKQKKLVNNITLTMDFNNLFFDAVLFDTDICKDNELKLEDLLKYESLQALCFSSSFCYVEHPHVFSITFYHHLLSIDNNSLSYYYYLELYMAQVKKVFEVNDLIKVDCLKILYLKSLKLIIYLIWDMEYYLDKNFNPIENKSLSVSIFSYDWGSSIYYIKLSPYKKFNNLNNFNDLLPFFFKLNNNEINFFNINLNFAFYEKVFYILNFNNRFFNHAYYNNEIFERKVESYKDVWEREEGFEDDGLESFINDLIEIPNQRDLDFMNNKINTFMNDWLKQRDENVKEANYKRLKEVEEEMEFLINHQLKDE